MEPFRDLLCAALDGELPAGPVSVAGVGVVADPAAATLAAGRELLRLVRAGQANTDAAANCLRALSGLSGWWDGVPAPADRARLQPATEPAGDVKLPLGRLPVAGASLFEEPADEHGSALSFSANHSDNLA